MRDLTTALFLSTSALVAFTACTPATVVQTQPPPQAPVASTSQAGDATQTGLRGSVIGTVTTNPWHALKNAGGVVYLEDAPADGSRAKSATLDNHDMAFDPFLVVISAGGSVIFTNTDPLLHNVFTPDGDKWDLGDIPQNGSVARHFESPARYTVLCNRHPGMIAYLVVTPTNYFARLAADGTFSIKGVPAGTYRMTAWVPRLAPVTQSVTVAAGETTANFDLAR